MPRHHTGFKLLVNVALFLLLPLSGRQVSPLSDTIGKNLACIWCNVITLNSAYYFSKPRIGYVKILKETRRP